MIEDEDKGTKKGLDSCPRLRLPCACAESIALTHIEGPSVDPLETIPALGAVRALHHDLGPILPATR